MNDLERRVRDLERELIEIGRAARSIEFTAREAAGAMRIGSGRTGRPPSTTPVNDTPCCPGVPAPATLTARFPGGQTATLTYAAGTRDWSGTVTLPDAQVRTGFLDILGICGYDQFGVPVNESYTFALRAACAAGGGFLLTGTAQFGFRAVFGRATPGDSPAVVRPYTVPSPFVTCRTVAFTAGVGTLGPGQCNPFNVALGVGSAILGVPLASGQQILVYA